MERRGEDERSGEAGALGSSIRHSPAVGFYDEGVQMHGKVETTTTTITTAWEKQIRGESLTATCCIHLTLPNNKWTSDIFK